MDNYIPFWGELILLLLAYRSFATGRALGQHDIKLKQLDGQVRKEIKS